MIISSQEHLISHTHVGEHLGSCDHNLIRFTINLTRPESYDINVKIPNYKLADYKNFSKSLNNLSLNDTGSTEKMWNNFKHQFLEKQNNHIPMKNRNYSTNNKPPWYTTEIAKAICYRNKCYKLR